MALSYLPCSLATLTAHKPKQVSCVSAEGDFAASEDIFVCPT